MTFDTNPLKGVHFGDKNKVILDSEGNTLLKRSGIDWSEDDQLPYDLLMKSMDYDYQADLLNYQNEYNSPFEQAKRMREAGINPDLVGTQNVSSASSNATAPNTQLNEGAETQRKLQMAQSFIQLLPQAIKIYTDMVHMNQSRTLGDIEILKGIQNLGDGEIKRQFTLSDLGSKVSMPQANLSHIRNKKLRSRVDDYIFNLVSDSSNRDYAKSLVYDTKRSAETNRQGFLNLLGNYGYDIDDDLFVSTLRDFNKVLFGSQKAKYKYDKTYYDSIDPSEDAKLHNSETKLKQKRADNDFMAELMSRANKKFDSDDRTERASGLLMYLILSLAQAQGLK